MEAEKFRKNGEEVLKYITSYFEKIREKRTVPNVKPGFLLGKIPDEAPEQPEEWNKVFSDVEEIIQPGLMHWQSPHFHAFYPALASYPGILADMLISSFNCMGFSWISGPICTELERAMLDWFVKLLGLPEEFLYKDEGGLFRYDCT